MKCSICKSELEEKEIIKNLFVFHCNTCSGNFLRFEDYLAWKTINARKKDESTYNFDEPLSNDDSEAKLCSECNGLMTRYRVSNDLDFYLDYCGNCNGIWFDKGELEKIIDKNLHHDIQYFFTQKWQKNIRDEKTKQHFENMYLKRFGKENYDKIKDIREFIYSQDEEKSNYFLAFLNDKNPYKV